MKKTRKEVIELSEYEYALLVGNSMIFELFGSLLKGAKKKRNSYHLEVTLNKLKNLIGFVAAEANHSKSGEIQDGLNDLCDYLESMESYLERQ